MLWFFERDGEQIRYEVRPAEPLPGFELIVRFPNGAERREVFRTHADLLKRQAELDEQFEEEGWVEYASLDDNSPDLSAKPPKAQAS